MMYTIKIASHKERLLALLLSVWLIIIIVLLITLLSPILYDHQIGYFHLPDLVSLTHDEISWDYAHIVQYIIGNAREMKITSGLITTHEAYQHFEDVRNIFIFMRLYGLVGIGLIFPFIKLIRKKHTYIIKLLAITLLIIVIVAGSFMLLDFDGAFVLMHQLLFRNTYWLIDPQTDPIIDLFPEEFFLELGLIIISSLAITIVLLFLIDHFIKNHELKEEAHDNSK